MVGLIGLTGALRRLVQSPCDALISKGRVRMRRLTCVGCRRQTWVIVGPPHCPDCAQRDPRR